MENRDILAIQKMNVDEAKAELGNLNADQLGELRALEVAEGEGKTRSTLLKAIDTRMATIGDGEDGDATSTTTDSMDAEQVDQSSDDDRRDIGVDGDDMDDAALLQAGAPSVFVTEERCKEIVADAVAAAEKRLATAAVNGVNVGGGDASPRITDTPPVDRDAEEAERQRQARADEVAAQILAGEEAEERAHEARIAEQGRRAFVAQAAYARAKSGETSRWPGTAIDDGARLYFSDGSRFIPEIGHVAVPARAVFVANGKLVINQAINFDPTLPSSLVTEVWLEPMREDAFVKCEIPGGLRIGQGHEAQLPSGHLAFDMAG